MRKIQTGNRILQTTVAGLVLMAILLAVYANSFDAAWQYDDYGNIIHNRAIQMTRWSWDQTITALTSGLGHQTVSRPLAYLSFALNHRLGGFDVRGYHWVNFVIHWLTACVLFLFVRRWLQLPQWSSRIKRINAVAFIAAILWATHPIHATAVTIVVQRMASMAGLFYIAALYCFLRARLQFPGGMRVFWTCATAVLTLAALLTKENAVMLLYIFVLTEYCLFGSHRSRQGRTRYLWVAAGTIAIVAIGFLYTDPTRLFQPYEIRPYTWDERLLTQTRVIWFYLTLLVVPMTSRLSLLHDFEISRGLFEPWTTAAAMLGWIIVCAVLAVMVIKRRHILIAYCMLFFLLNHVIEGSIFNLELVYEHRNYIPSMLLFVPIGLIWDRSLDRFAYSRPFRYAIVATAAIVILSQGMATYLYNGVFATEYALWRHVIRRSPRLSVAHNNLGNLYWNDGQRDAAAASFNKAHALDHYFNLRHKGLVHHNLGLVALYHRRDLTLAKDHFQTADAFTPDNARIRYQMSKTLMLLNDDANAQDMVTQAMGKWPDNPAFVHLQSVLALKSNQYDKAAEYARRALRLSAEHINAMAVLAESSRRQGDVSGAVKQWEQLLAVRETNVLGLMALIDLTYGRQPQAARRYVDRLAAASGGIKMRHLVEMAHLSALENGFGLNGERIMDKIRSLSE